MKRALLMIAIAALAACGSADEDPALLDLVQKPDVTARPLPVKP